MKGSVKMFQLLIKNGTVFDPANQVSQTADVAVADGKIAGIGQFEATAAQHTINAAGCIVTPGLVDHHAHLYPLAKIGIPAETVCFSSGVTSAVDAGSTGSANYRDIRPFLEQTQLTIRPYVHVSPLGLSTLPTQTENVDPAVYDEGALRELFQEYGEQLAGLKLRTSAPIVRELGYEPLRQTIRLADRLGVSVMVHCTNPPGSMDELINYLRPGDVLTHMYMNIGSTILDDSGHVRASVRQARARGVLFEAADARAHFGFSTAIPAIQEGFWPDFIGTDLTVLSMHLPPTSFNLAMQISRYVNLGIPLMEVIRRCTINPAKQLKLHDGAGTLSVGAAADCAVFRPVEGSVIFGDRPYGNPDQTLRSGNVVYEPVLTLKKGAMVYRNVTF
jgi:predicted amidohydrolase